MDGVARWLLHNVVGVFVLSPPLDPVIPLLPRVALLTGRNSHSANMGGVAEMGTAFPGMNCVRPQSVAPLAEILRLNGYGTAMFGKSHELPPWELSVSGPLNRWPAHSGFDKFYGFLQGESDLYSPALYDGVTRIPTFRDPDYHVSTDITDKAIVWVRSQQSLTPDKPFFIYYAAAGTHDPHHVPKEWIDKYKGKFDQGWDKLREETPANVVDTLRGHDRAVGKRVHQHEEPLLHHHRRTEDSQRRSRGCDHRARRPLADGACTCTRANRIAYNWFGRELYEVSAPKALPPGAVTLRWELRRREDTGRQDRDRRGTGR
jgi:arylsulfatase A-like enzyme